MASFVHELEEAAKRGGACLLCDVETQQSDRYLEGIIADGVNDPKLRLDLRRRGGYCPRHLGRFTGLAHLLAAAIVLHDVLSARLERASQGKITGDARCPACEIEAKARQSVLGSLKRQREDARLQAVLREAPLCIVHLELVARFLPSLREALAGRHAELVQALSELIRKHDYRFAREAIFEDERVSIAKAAGLFRADVPDKA